MDWKECNKKNFVKKVNRDNDLIESLIKSSRKKFESNKRLNLDNVTSSAKIGLIYESLREILEALALKKGFKIYNHECFSSFLENVCKDQDFSLEFDKFRKIRNQINYYGKQLSINETKIIIKDIHLLLNKIYKKYFK